MGNDTSLAFPDDEVSSHCSTMEYSTPEQGPREGHPQQDQNHQNNDIAAAVAPDCDEDEGEEGDHQFQLDDEQLKAVNSSSYTASSDTSLSSGENGQYPSSPSSYTQSSKQLKDRLYQKISSMSKSPYFKYIVGAIAFLITLLILRSILSSTVDEKSASSSLTSTTSAATNSPTSVQTDLPTMQPSGNATSTPTKTPTTSNPTRTPTSNPTNVPTSTPTSFSATYRPGNLTTMKDGLLLSEGLDVRMIATLNEQVTYWNDTKSTSKFHERPDGGDTFDDTREWNKGGWVYVSNSEVTDQKGKGGVGAFTFNKHGQLINYEMVLEDTTWNCGGGKTPWNTWVSCEEIEFDGLIYQVDPFGVREAEVMTLGSDGGRWESFAYDVRDKAKPHFFATEDHNKGTVRRFTPSNPDWENDPWKMLHGDGITDYLTIAPNATNNGGTFKWTNDIEAGRNNARSFYPQTEGIDIYNNEMYFVCKNIRQIFVLDLDQGTYWNATTVNGMFDGKPDQMTRILDDNNEILYFTEEQGADNGIHARDSQGRYYSILEGIDYNDETTGLAFSPDGMHMYFAFQDSNVLFDVFRADGLPFNARKLDVKYHADHHDSR